MTALKITKKQYTEDIFSNNETSTLKLFVNWLSSFIIWWYVTMPVTYVMSLREVCGKIDKVFGITFLFKTFITPIFKEPTIFGYVFGLILRMILIPLGIILITIVFSIFLVFFIFWILVPISTILLISISPFISI